MSLCECVYIGIYVHRFNVTYMFKSHIIVFYLIPKLTAIMCVLVAQSRPTLQPLGLYKLLGSSVHGILQARILERVAISSSRASSRSRDWTSVSCIASRFFTTEPPGKLVLPGSLLLKSPARYLVSVDSEVCAPVKHVTNVLKNVVFRGFMFSQVSQIGLVCFVLQ